MSSFLVHNVKISESNKSNIENNVPIVLYRSTFMKAFSFVDAPKVESLLLRHRLIETLLLRAIIIIIIIMLVSRLMENICEHRLLLRRPLRLGLLAPRRLVARRVAARVDAHRRLLAPPVGDGARAVVLDFSSMEYMNSGGIGLLVQLLVRANRSKHGLAATGLSDHYRQIFQVTRLDEAITIHDDVDTAVAAAG